MLTRNNPEPVVEALTKFRASYFGPITVKNYIHHDSGRRMWVFIIKIPAQLREEDERKVSCLLLNTI